MRRVCVVITARPSYSRIKSVLSALKARKDTELIIVPAASACLWKYGRVVDQMVQDGFGAHLGPEVHGVVEGGGVEHSAVSTGLLTSQLAHVLWNLKPDVVVTVADRHETLATAIAASYQNIPLCHVQGGEVSGSIDDRVRNAISQLSDFHCVSTAQAASNIFKMSPGAEVFVTGCPSIDIAREAERLGPLPGHNIVVLQHPVTSEADYAKAQIEETIEAVNGEDVLWFWPGEDAGGDAMSKALRMAGIKPRRNMESLEFLRMLMGSGCLVGNSSVGIRECSFLGVPAVNIGTRQFGRERGANVVDVPYDAEAIREAVDSIMWKRKPSTTLYGDGHAGERIAAILAGEAMEAVA